MIVITEEEIKARTPDRFWKKINFGKPDECWDWTGAQIDDGYGVVIWWYGTKWKNKQATRLITELVVGELNSNVCVMHTCDRPCCCNPSHFKLGTRGDNCRDRTKKLRQARGSQHGMAILQEHHIPEIRNMIKEGISKLEIGVMFGVDRTTISKIACNKTWKHLAG